MDRCHRTRACRGRFLIFYATVVLAAVGCVAFESSSEEPENGPSLCSQQMCVFLFDRLEQQSIRLHNIEDALMRTVSILASVKNQEFSAASAVLKSDPLLNSLLKDGADVYDDPVESILLRSDQISNSLESPIRGRKKRQTERQPMSPKERLVEALKWAKKSTNNNPIPTTTSSMELNAGFQLLLPPEEIRQDAVVKQTPSSELKDGEVFLLPMSLNETDINKNMTRIRIFATRPVPREAPKAPETTTLAPTSITSTNVPLMRSTTKILSNMLTSTVASDQPATRKFVKDAVGDLTGAMKCAMAQLGEYNVSEPSGVLSNPRAILNPDKTLTVQFELNSCIKYWVSVWIRISLRNELMFLRSGRSHKANHDNQEVLQMQIPKECLSKTGNEFSITLSSNAKAPCNLTPLPSLMECKVYSVKIIPIYFSLQGQASIVEVTVPPQLTGNSTDLITLEHNPASNSTHMLGLHWSAQSHDCAQLMTSVDLRIYEDASDSILRSFTVPSDCIAGAYENSFSATFSSIGTDNTFCSGIRWEPLDICRKYKLEVEPEYSNSLKGKSSSLEIFTSGADRTNCCYMLTSSSGVLRSLNGDENFGCTWLITVDKNSTIWLTFTEFYIEGYYYSVKVYDGPYSTSPLLLDRYGNQPPKPVRSRSNKLFIQLSSTVNRNNQYGKQFTAYYIAVKGKRTPYVDGCGGYIVNTGNVLKPAYPPSENSSAECMWYIESSGERNTTLITSQSRAIIPFPVIVYDGWSSEGTVIYNGSSRASIYSYGRKTLVKFPAWNSLEREREYSWNIFSSQGVEQCSYNLTSSSDTFSSPTGNNIYSSLLDCRWAITVDNTSKILLTFVYFDTERDHDFVSIYDGPTFYSPLLLELTGKKSKPVSITSTNNQFLVRFSTNENSENGVFYKGFLAFYTTVPREFKAQKAIIDEAVISITQSSIELQNALSTSSSTSTSDRSYWYYWNGTTTTSYWNK